MKSGIIGKILGHKPRPGKRLIAVTSERTGDHSLSGVESFLSTIGVPEPFSLEMAGDSAGVTLLARCQEGSFVKQQVGAFYPQARVSEVSPEEDPLRLAEGEQAWSTTLRLRGPEYLPLRTFRDEDLKEPGSDPLVSLIGAMSGLGEGERLVARIKLLSLGPDWARQHQQRAQHRQQSSQAGSAPDGQEQFQTKQAVSFVILGLTALVGLRGYFWIRAGETWKAALLGLGVAAGLVVAGWALWRIKKFLSVSPTTPRWRWWPSSRSTATSGGPGKCCATRPWPTGATTIPPGPASSQGRSGPSFPKPNPSRRPGACGSPATSWA